MLISCADLEVTKTSSRNVEAVRSVKLKKKKIFLKAYGSPVPPSVGAFLPSLPHCKEGGTMKKPLAKASRWVAPPEAGISSTYTQYRAPVS